MDRALTRRRARRLVEAANAAPSIYSNRPWRFVIKPAERTIEICADPARMLRGGDPHGRTVHIAGGAALFNLRLAAFHEGVEPVTRLLPQPRNPLLLAQVRLAGRYRPRPADRDLYGAIGRAGTGRQEGVSRSLIAVLAEEARLEGATLRTMATPHTRTEPAAALAPEEPPVSPQLAVLCTRTDDPPSWLRVGQAMQRVLLFATHRGLLAASLALVPDETRPMHGGDPAVGGEHAQLIVRLGDAVTYRTELQPSDSSVQQRSDSLARVAFNRSMSTLATRLVSS
jgi:nitroreductase